jgi:cobalamin biosynthesis protein CbiD
MTTTLIAAAAAALVLGACTTHKVKVEHEVKEPITLNVNMNVKIDRELDEFFDFEQELQGRPEPINDQGAE